jgi:hypothetical protein
LSSTLTWSYRPNVISVRQLVGLGDSSRMLPDGHRRFGFLSTVRHLPAVAYASC